MSANPKHFLTPEEYLEIEEEAARRSEYFNGEMFLMAGASPRHVLIMDNTVIHLGVQIKRKRRCNIFSNDLRLQVLPTGLYTYPDIIVVCGAPEFAKRQGGKGRTGTLLNPTLIVEVLSDSTKDYDRGEKFAHYRALESLRQYVLIAQNKVHVELFTRQVDGWLLTETNNREDVIALPSIECELSLTEAYDGYEALPVTADNDDDETNEMRIEDE
ncbi:MAG: Uma2 family endonuclease [Pyrinomonadaceae bacterium MAG19_C2-C3]|nr:Uma2 family endonuclease [Pyrinomonadaceae bacterium MAG19_C2-C3]